MRPRKDSIARRSRQFMMARTAKTTVAGIAAKSAKFTKSPANRMNNDGWWRNFGADQRHMSRDRKNAASTITDHWMSCQVDFT